MTRILPGRQAPRRKAIAAGFSLLEVSVAMAVFLVVSATAFTLFSRHESLLGAEQGIAGLNIGLRNALSQIQIDVVNAGSGVIQGPQIPAWPVGVTIINSNPSSACNVTTTNPPQYTATCFDTLNVVMVDANTPPLSPSNSCSGASFDTTAGTPLVGTVPAVINPATGLNWTTAQVAARFVTGDQILFMSGTVTGTTYPYTTALLTAAGATNASPAGVKLTFTPTLAGGANNASNDPISMTTAAPAGT